MAFTIRTTGAAAGALAILGVAAIPAQACELMRTAEKSMTPVASVQTTIGTTAATPAPSRKPAEIEPAGTTVAQPKPASPADTNKVDIAKAALPKAD